MLLKTFIVCLLVAFVLAQDVPGTRPSGETPSVNTPSSEAPSVDSPSSETVACFVDPCSLPPPSDCVFRYCRAHECTARYYDADGQEVCEGSTSVCSEVACELYCPYGYKIEEDCPVCACNERPVCTEACPAIACGDDMRAAFINGACCPTCVPTCETVDCPVLNCADGEEEFRGPYDCCSTCVSETICDGVACPDVMCRDGEQKVESGCCEVCVPRVDCTAVTCPEVLCAEGWRRVIDDYSCCPYCKQEVDCDNVGECPQITCTADQELVRGDDCCPECRDKNYCDTVVCPAFAGACPEDEDYQVQREDSCCPYCAGTVCKDTENTRCNKYDEPVCAPGYWKGENCSEAVPEADRVEIRIEIQVTGIELTEEDIKFFIANKLRIDPVYVTVDALGDGVFVIVISWDRNSPPEGTDFASLQQAVDNVIASNSNFQKKASSSASTLAVTAVLCVAALAL